MENPAPRIPVHGTQPCRWMNAPLLQQHPALLLLLSPAGSPGVQSPARKYTISPECVEVNAPCSHLVTVRWRWQPAGEHWGCCVQVRQLGSSVIRLSVSVFVCVSLSPWVCVSTFSSRACSVEDLPPSRSHTLSHSLQVHAAAPADPCGKHAEPSRPYTHTRRLILNHRSPATPQTGSRPGTVTFYLAVK